MPADSLSVRLLPIRQKARLLNEAARYHQATTQIQEILEPEFDRIDSLKTVLLAPKTPDSQATAPSLDRVKAAFEEWEKNRVEVPGMPHSPHHGTALTSIITTIKMPP